MKPRAEERLALAAFALSLFLVGVSSCGGGSEGPTGPTPPPVTPTTPTLPTAPTTVVVSVGSWGSGAGRVTGTMDGATVIDCVASGSTTSGICTVSVAVGNTIALIATPTTENTFQGWAGACSGTTASCTLTISSAIAVSAAFRRYQPGSAMLTLAVTDGTPNSGVVVTIANVAIDSVTSVGGTAIARLDSGGRVSLVGLPLTSSLLRVWLRDLPSAGAATLRVEEVSKAGTHDLRGTSELAAVTIALVP